MRSHLAGRVTGPAYRVLAALLLADGEAVTSWELGEALWEYVVPTASVRTHIQNLRRFGVAISHRPGRGYRLLSIPPDEHLEPMLACVPAVKRSAWWSRRVSQTHTRAS